MTYKDLKKRLKDEDLDKVILFSDGKGTTNIDVTVTDNSIIISGSDNSTFSEDSNNIKVSVYDCREGNLNYVGYISTTYFNKSELFNSVNWSEYQSSPPSNNHCSLSSVGHGVCFHNPIDNIYYLSLSIGWKIGTIREIEKYIKENKGRAVWLEG